MFAPSRTLTLGTHCSRGDRGNLIFFSKPWPGLRLTMSASCSVRSVLSSRLTSTIGWLASQPASWRICATVISASSQGLIVPSTLTKYLGSCSEVVTASALISASLFMFATLTQPQLGVSVANCTIPSRVDHVKLAGDVGGRCQYCKPLAKLTFAGGNCILAEVDGLYREFGRHFR